MTSTIESTPGDLLPECVIKACERYPQILERYLRVARSIQGKTGQYVIFTWRAHKRLRYGGPGNSSYSSQRRYLLAILEGDRLCFDPKGQFWTCALPISRYVDFRDTIAERGYKIVSGSIKEGREQTLSDRVDFSIDSEDEVGSVVAGDAEVELFFSSHFFLSEIEQNPLADKHLVGGLGRLELTP
jgi:hypothetical protein